MALVKPGGERTEHKAYESTNRTCYLCHRLVGEVDDIYFVYENNAILCSDHRDSDGYHGQYADRSDKPHNPMQVVRYLHSSKYVEGTRSKRRSRKAEPAAPKVKPVEADINEGEMVPEVAEFLKKMGRL